MKLIKASLVALSLAVVPVSTAMASRNISLEEIIGDFITWKAETIDVGEIPQGVPYTIKFEFKNTTNNAILITNVKASCGCTATDYTKTKIEKGQTGYVNATYNAAHAGAFTKTVTVTTSDSNAPKVLTFKGKVVAKS